MPVQLLTAESGLAVAAHSDLTGLTAPNHDHTQYWYTPGLSGGFAGFGGTDAGDIWELTAADASPDTGRVHINSPIELFYDTASNTTPAEQYAMRMRVTSSLGAYVGGFLRVDNDFTSTSSTYIPGIFVDGGTSRVGTAPGFWAYTFENVLHTIRNSGNFNLGNALVQNVGLAHERNTSGTSTVPSGSTGMNFSAQSRATVSGAVMTKLVGDTAVSVAPTFSTVAGSTINGGTVTGIRTQQPVAALAQPSAGTENYTAFFGLDMGAMTHVTSGDKAAVRNQMTDAADRYAFLNSGGARSDWGGGDHFDLGITQHLGDGVTFSSSYGAAGGDTTVYWDGSRHVVDPSSGDLWRQTLASGSTTFDSDASTYEVRFDVQKMAFLQSGSVGNQKAIFAAPAETITVGGEYSQYLLTQSANDLIDAALGLYAGWTINAPTPTIGTGSLTTGVALNVGGNPTGTTNKAGIRILTNPSGAASVNAALWVTAGDAVLDGDLDHGGTNVGFYGATPVAQSAAYTRNATVVEDRTLLASASATTLNNNNVLAALIADLQALGLIG